MWWNGTSQSKTQGDVASYPRTKRGRGRVPERGEGGGGVESQRKAGARDTGGDTTCGKEMSRRET